MTANDIAWAIGIAIPLAIFAVLVISAVRRYLSEPIPGRHRLDEQLRPDPEREAEALRRAERAWQAIQASVKWGPCRFCGTRADRCTPRNPCCTGCAGRFDAHPVITKGGEQ